MTGKPPSPPSAGPGSSGIFSEALERTRPGDAQWLDGRLRGRPALLQDEVRSLLVAHDRADRFETPAASLLGEAMRGSTRARPMKAVASGRT